MITKTLTIAGQEVKRAIMTAAALEVYLEILRKLGKAYPEWRHLCAIAKDKHAKEQAPDTKVNLP